MTLAPAVLSQSSSAEPIEDYRRAALIARFHRVRALSEELANPLSAEDQSLQSMPDASPTKWHLAHSSWFFEAIVLTALDPSYVPFDSSICLSVQFVLRVPGGQAPASSAWVALPTGAHRCHAISRSRHRRRCGWPERIDDSELDRVLPLVELGMNHEEQHQELILTDIKHALYATRFAPLIRQSEMCRHPPAPRSDGSRFLAVRSRSVTGAAASPLTMNDRVTRIYCVPIGWGRDW